MKIFLSHQNYLLTIWLILIPPLAPGAQQNIRKSQKPKSFCPVRCSPQNITSGTKILQDPVACTFLLRETRVSAVIFFITAFLGHCNSGLLSSCPVACLPHTCGGEFVSLFPASVTLVSLHSLLPGELRGQWEKITRARVWNQRNLGENSGASPFPGSGVA